MIEEGESRIKKKTSLNKLDIQEYNYNNMNDPFEKIRGLGSTFEEWWDLPLILF